MPPKKDFSDLDLTEKLLKEDKSTRAVSVSSFEDEESVASDASPAIVWISEPCQGFNAKNLKKQASRSPLLGGCICKCLLISFLLMFTLTLITTVFCYAKVKDVVQHLTIQGHHRSFPVIDMSDAEVDVLQDRVKLFVDELRRGSSSMPLDDLVITQDEINGLLCHSDYLRGNMQVTLQENKILEEYSLPMDMFPGGKGRYFDGHDSTKIMPSKNRMELQMETTALHKDWFVGPLYLLNLSYNVNDSNQYHQRLLEIFMENGSTIFGNVIPDDFIQQHNNLLDGAYSDPDSGFDVRTVVDGIQGVQIMDGKIVIQPRRRHQDDAEEKDGEEQGIHPVPADGEIDVKPSVEEEEDEEDIHIVPANPFPSAEESNDDEMEVAAVEWYQEPVSSERQPQEPITVEVMAETLPEDNESSMDVVDRDDDEDGAEATNAADTAKLPKDSTFLRSHKVPAAAPTKAASVTATTTTTASNLRTTKTSP